MIALKPTSTGDTVHCSCCGKTFIADKTINGIEVLILDKVSVRAELCPACHRKSSRGKREPHAVGRRVVERYDREFAVLMLLLLFSAKGRRILR